MKGLQIRRGLAHLLHFSCLTIYRGNYSKWMSWDKWRFINKKRKLLSVCIFFDRSPEMDDVWRCVCINHFRKKISGSLIKPSWMHNVSWDALFWNNKQHCLYKLHNNLAVASFCMPASIWIISILHDIWRALPQPLIILFRWRKSQDITCWAI